MKTNTILIAALMLTASVYAQGQKYFSDFSSHQRADINKSVKCYLECLKSTNEGVVQSGLAHVGRLKLYFPEYRSDMLQKEIRSLSTGGATFNIRYRAYLLCSLFDNPALFAKESRQEFGDPDELFTALAGRLQQSLLGLSETISK